MSGPASKQQRLLCYPSLDDFWRCLPEAAIRKNTLQLPGDMTFSGDSRLPNRLFIWKAYIKLHELIHNEYFSKDILVLGSRQYKVLNLMS